MLSRTMEKKVQTLHQKFQAVFEEFKKLNTKELVKSRTHYTVSGLQQYVDPLADLFSEVVYSGAKINTDAIEYLLTLDKSYYYHKDLAFCHGSSKKLIVRVVIEHGMYAYNFRLDSQGCMLKISW